MGKKRIPLREVQFKHAWSAVVNGKKGNRSRQLNPYRKYTTLWYVWKTGYDNPTLPGLYLIQRLRELNYPIGVE
jgi:hypothetical protein